MSRITVSRREILLASGTAMLGAAGGLALGMSAQPSPGPSPIPPTVEPGIVPFEGRHQAGVETPPAAFQTFVGLDLRAPSAQRATAVARLVTDDARRLTQGAPALADTEPDLAVHPARLTVTLGVGRRLLTRIGLPDRIPPELVPIPRFRTDRIETGWEQTDFVLQIGSEDPVTLAHAVRVLIKDTSTLASVRWLQPGFRSQQPALPGSPATRNLMGQVDGTVNPQPGSEQFRQVVWMPDSNEWWANGTILVLRRIRMLLDDWEALDRPTQEAVIGRKLDTGAPLGGSDESDPVRLDAVDDLGLPLIPVDAHVRVAHAGTTREMIWRRPYSYDAGMANGTNDMGLLFAAYTRDPRASFIPMQERIARSDAFNRWNTTIGSAAYLIPGGVGPDGILAAGAFA